MWARVSARLSTSETRARLLFWMWLISLGVLLVGVGVIAWRIFAK